MKREKKYLVVIAGPTAVGKTALSVALAKHYKSVILSADSRQFYKEMNIGTAKPNVEELNAVQHFFIGNKSVTELYGAGHYEKDAVQLLSKLFEQHSIVFIVGGSGLYIDAVLNGVDDFMEIADNIREEINSEFESKGLEWLQDSVKQIDPDYYNSSDNKNTQRLKRAFEVYRSTGKPYSSFLGKKKSARDFIPIKILINTDRKILYQRIEERVDKMISTGLVDEIKELLKYKDYNALKTVGYKEIIDYIDGKHDLATAVKLIKQHSRNYAKRQITWFKNKDTFRAFDRTESEKIISYIDSIINE